VRLEKTAPFVWAGRISGHVPGHDEFGVNSRPQKEILEIIDPKSKAIGSKISCPK
jgi:hypothetical protein